MSEWLGRWRISGVNWEGRRWVLTAGAQALIPELMARFPNRTPYDGTVASQGHDSRSPSSDHRPHPIDASPATVRAIDVGEAVEDEGAALFELLRQTRDPRIKYVLHEDKIFSSYARTTRDPWEVHTQSVGHPNHVHISFTDLADDDTSPWNLGGKRKEDDDMFVFESDPDSPRKERLVEFWSRQLARAGQDIDPRNKDYVVMKQPLFNVAGFGVGGVGPGEADRILAAVRANETLPTIVDEEARQQAGAAHDRLDKLHQV